MSERKVSIHCPVCHGRGDFALLDGAKCEHCQGSGRNPEFYMNLPETPDVAGGACFAPTQGADARPVAWSADALYDAIEEVLLHHRVSNFEGDDGEAYPLVDQLTTSGADSVESGQFEIRLICDAIYNEVLTVAAPISDRQPVAIVTQIPELGCLRTIAVGPLDLDALKIGDKLYLATRDATPSDPWISAPEALPTKPGNYLAMMADENSFGYTSDEPVLVEFDAYTDHPGQFTISDSWTNGPETATDEVEFWMPLPSRPTKGKT